MKDHGILFKGEMVRQILAGNKTVTRRVMRVQPSRQQDATLATLIDTTDSSKRKHIGKSHWTGVAPNGYEFGWSDEKYFRCPYGFAGDRLWVRENIQILSFGANTAEITYPAKQGDRRIVSDRKLPDRLGTVPSILMPRQCSRITLLVKSVKVERVQQIDELGALAEGVECDETKTVHSTMHTSAGKITGEWIGGRCRDGFQQLWDSINAARGYSWESNPWVWVIEFERADR